jgi:hypothetical protein
MSRAQHGPGWNGGAIEVNPLDEATIAAREAIDHGASVWFGDDNLAKITRLRLLSDPGLPWWDMSYCYGELKDGTPVRVTLPTWNFGKHTLKRDLIAMGKEHGVYVKGLGMLDDAVISTLM